MIVEFHKFTDKLRPKSSYHERPPYTIPYEQNAPAHNDPDLNHTTKYF